MASGQRIIIKLPRNIADIEALLEKISEKAAASIISTEIRNDKLVIEIQGSVRASKDIKKAVHDVLRGLTSRSFRSVITEDRIRDMGYKGPIDVLSFTLKKMGFDTEWEPPVLRSNAQASVIRQAAQKLSEALKMVNGLSLSESARKAVIAVLALSGTTTDVKRVISVGLSKGVLARDRNNKILSVTEWREAADLIRGSLGVDGGP
ncbi:DUF2067 family protein [Acidilobus sp.]|uniref:DUF2067 family protein n=1 Tax=Acidilobus sp. TaxID=1872109 RepID=UPI003D071CC7